MASEGAVRDPWRPPPEGMARVRLIPRTDLTYELHRFDHRVPDPDYPHPDCVVRRVMES